MEKALFHVFKGICDIAATFILQIWEKIWSLNSANADFRISDAYVKSHDYVKFLFYFFTVPITLIQIKQIGGLKKKKLQP